MGLIYQIQFGNIDKSNYKINGLTTFVELPINQCF